MINIMSTKNLCILMLYTGLSPQQTPWKSKGHLHRITLFTVVLETKDQIRFAAQNRDIIQTAGAEICSPSDSVVYMVPIPHHVIISIP